MSLKWRNRSKHFQSVSTAWDNPLWLSAGRDDVEKKSAVSFLWIFFPFVCFSFISKIEFKVHGWGKWNQNKKVQSVFRVSIPWVQTGTILSCICCMWDNIPCALLRILSWCAAKEIPILAMSLFERNTRRRWWKRSFNLLLANKNVFPFSSFAKSKNSVWTFAWQSWEMLQRDLYELCTELWLPKPYVRAAYPRVPI